MISRNIISNGLMLFISLCSLKLSCSRGEDNYQVNKNILPTPFEITIYDSDYSMAFSRIYTLREDSIHIVFSGELVGEIDTVIFERELSKDERIEIMKFFTIFPLDKLEPKYIIDTVFDGDQKLFMFKIGTIEKRIQVSNYFQEDLASLIDLVNKFVPVDYRIKYNR